MNSVLNICFICVVVAPILVSVGLANSDLRQCASGFAPPSEEQNIQSRLIAHEVSKANLQALLEVLTGERPMFYHHKLNDRYTSSNRELTRLYLITTLKQFGLDVRVRAFDKGVNIFADIIGTERPNEVFEVAAHYDSARVDVPGADDNGSGVAIVLEMARLFSKNPPKKTLRLTFLDLEETGGQGADAHVKQLAEEFKQLANKDAAENRKAFLGSLIVDMVGYNPSTGPQKLLLEIGERRHFGSIFGGKLAEWSTEDAYHFNLSCARAACDQFLRFALGKQRYGELNLNFATETASPDSADHGSYWKQGLPAMLLATPYEKTYQNPSNHTSGDTIGKINWRFFISAAELAVEIAASMTEASSTLPDEARASAYAERNPDFETLSNSEIDPVKDLTVHKPKPELSSVLANTSSAVSNNLSWVDKALNNQTALKTLAIALTADSERADVFYVNKHGALKSHYLYDVAKVKAALRKFSDQGLPIFRKKTNDVILSRDLRAIVGLDNDSSDDLDALFDLITPEELPYSLEEEAPKKVKKSWKIWLD